MTTVEELSLITANAYTDVLYGLAMNNFLAMVPEFFLKNKKGLNTSYNYIF